MLKYRLILGVIFSAILVALIWADSALAAKGLCPKGTVVAILTVAVVPFALLEMRNMLAKGGVVISVRIATVACLLCALWPWIEQVAEQAAPAAKVETKPVNVETQPATTFATGDERLIPRPLTYPEVVAAPAVQTTKSARVTNYTLDVGIEEIHRSTQPGNSPQVLAASQPAPPPPTVWSSIAARVRTVKPHYLVPTVLAAAMLAALVYHSRKQQVHGAMASAGGTLMAIVYLGVLPGFFLPICLTHSAWMLLAIICIVKSADIGAYTVGRLIGRHKLIPWLSPGKTIEGFFGGLLFSAAVGMGAATMFEHFQWQQGLIAGLVLGAVGQVGDLVESLLKRDAGVKDSGTVPGFGGILDLLDSPLLAAPAAYWLLKLLVTA